MFNTVQIAPHMFLIRKQGKMETDVIIYTSPEMLKKIKEDETLKQIVQVSMLKGARKVMLMPDAHQGYGFPIGSVAAFSKNRGIISPGGVGYDINCGVRLTHIMISKEEFLHYLTPIANRLYRLIPKGAITDRSIFPLYGNQIEEVMAEGVTFAIKNGFGVVEDTASIEDFGCMKGADPDTVSQTARERGEGELGSLGSGNHFLEIDRVVTVYDESLARKMHITRNDIYLLLHTGSRGLGHQVAIDYVKMFRTKTKKYGLNIPSKELSSLPFSSKEGQQYFKAMQSAANFAFANRQILAFRTVEIISEVLKKTVEYETIYDLCHNIAKIEEHRINSNREKLVIHRKGATRAFPPGDKRTNSIYRETGQPILIPGTMGTGSYVCVGVKEGEESLFSVCHGAGRILGRRAAFRNMKGGNIANDLKKQGILVLSPSRATLLEEAPAAYKDVDKVIEVSEKAKLLKKVAYLRPLLVIKG